MSAEVLKAAGAAPADVVGDVAEQVAAMLARLAAGGEAAARDYALALDGWEGAVVLSPRQVAAAADQVPEALKQAIGYAHENIRRFAEAQRASVREFEVELRPGLMAGQRLLPLSAAGCYVPGGRYAHIASALMSITTARVAGVRDITVCSPPRGAAGIAPALLYAMSLAGADRVLVLGGVQALAAMAQGLFGAPAADILVGPGNAFVAEAKRQLFGPVGIDMFAGPTDLLVVADRSADPQVIAWDLAAQAEHGASSPVWLVTDHRPLAEAVLRLLPTCFDQLPEPNATAARQAWEGLGEVRLCSSREEMAALADDYAPEHLHVQAADPAWWRARLGVYGSLFLGAETAVAFGDKAAGPNHVLPTARAARYTGGLSVHKFLKVVTWQRAVAPALPDLVRATARISRAEGMEGHAHSAELRRAGP